MEYSVVKKIHIPKNKCRSIGPYFYYEKEDALFFEAPYPFPVQLVLKEGLSKCEVTPMFLKLPFILKGWINLDILLREIDLLKMVLKDKILLHASCVSGTLIVGMPNSGKTYKTLQMKNLGGKMISEEYTIIKAGEARPYLREARSCLSRNTIKKCKIKISFWERFRLFINTIRAKLMPFMFEDVIWKKFPLSGDTAKVKKIVYGSTGNPLTHWKQLAILTENEFPFMANEFLQAYALATGLDLIYLQEKQRFLIKEFFNAIHPDHSAKRSKNK